MIEKFLFHDHDCSLKEEAQNTNVLLDFILNLICNFVFYRMENEKKVKVEPDFIEK